jgi:hypothetical protein
LAGCLEETTNIIAGSDLEIAWISTNFLTICENEFNNNNCGVFLEIHMPGNYFKIAEYKITNYYVNAFSTVFMSTKALCAGNFEVKLNF